MVMTVIIVTAAMCWILNMYCTSMIILILLKSPTTALPWWHHGIWMRLENHADRSLFNSCPHLLKLAFLIAWQSHCLLQAVHSPVSSPPFQSTATAPSAKDAHPSLFPSVAFLVLIQDLNQIPHSLGGLPWLFQYSWTVVYSFVLWMYFIVQSLFFFFF